MPEQEIATLPRWNDWFDSEDQARLAWGAYQLARHGADVERYDLFPQDRRTPQEPIEQRLDRIDKSLLALWKQFHLFQRLTADWLGVKPEDDKPPEGMQLP